MSRFTSRGFLVAGAATMLACGELPVSDEATPLEVLVFAMRTEERTWNDCVAGSGACTYVRVDYPEVMAAPPGFAVEKLEATIRDRIQARYMEDGSYRSPTELMLAFFAEYEAMVSRQPDATAPWFLERKAFVLTNQRDRLSLSFSERAHTGGAHETETLEFENLHPATGESVTLASLLRPGYEPELTALAEEKFRNEREIPAGQSLTEAGFTFEEDSFSLTDNVAIEEDRLTFYYNPYEIAPYPLGPTEIHVSFDELRGLMKEE